MVSNFRFSDSGKIDLKIFLGTESKLITDSDAVSPRVARRVEVLHLVRASEVDVAFGALTRYNNQLGLSLLQNGETNCSAQP